MKKPPLFIEGGRKHNGHVWLFNDCMVLGNMGFCIHQAGRDFGSSCPLSASPPTMVVNGLISLKDPLCIAQGDQDHWPAFGFLVEVTLDGVDDIFFAAHSASVYRLQHALANLGNQYF